MPANTATRPDGELQPQAFLVLIAKIAYASGGREMLRRGGSTHARSLYAPNYITNRFALIDARRGDISSGRFDERRSYFREILEVNLIFVSCELVITF